MGVLRHPFAACPLHTQMRDHLEQVHVGYQRTEPDVTFMIEGLVGIYEAMLSDLVVHGVPENVGGRHHVETRFPGLTDERKEKLTDLFADRPDWRERSHHKAVQDLRTAGVVETQGQSQHHPEG